MKRILVFLVVLLAVFAFVSCKNEPEQKDDDTTPASPAGGVLTVRVGEGAAWNSAGRFQFFINETISEYDTIEFLLKMSDSFSSVVVRSSDATNSWAKFATVSVSPEIQNADGWYVISDVTASEGCDAFAVSAMLKSGETQNDTLFVQISNLKINGHLIDFTTCDAETIVTSFTGAAAPDKLSVTIE